MDILYRRYWFYRGIAGIWCFRNKKRNEQVLSGIIPTRWNPISFMTSIILQVTILANPNIRKKLRILTVGYLGFLGVKIELQLMTTWAIRKTYNTHKESSITRTIDKPWPHSYNHKHKLIPIKHIKKIGNKEGRKSYENKYDCKEQKTDVPLLYVLYGWIRFYFHMIYAPECFGKRRSRQLW